MVRTVPMDVHVISGSVMATGGRPLLAEGTLSYSDNLTEFVSLKQIVDPFTVHQLPQNRLVGMRRAGFSPSTVFSSLSKLRSDGLPSIDNQNGTKWRDSSGPKSVM